MTPFTYEPTTASSPTRRASSAESPAFEHLESATQSLSSLLSNFDVEDRRPGPEPVSWHVPFTVPDSDPTYVNKLLFEIRKQWGCDLWFVHLKDSGALFAIHPCTENAVTVEPSKLRAIAMDAGREASPISCGIPLLDVRPSMVLKQVFRRAVGISLGMPRRSGKISAVFAWEFDPSPAQQQGFVHWLKSDGGLVLGSFESWSLCQYAAQKVARHAAWMSWLRHWQIVAALACVAIAAMFVPISYRPQRDCVLESGTRHFVASPTEGRLMKTFVRPSDQVTKGQLLASLDDQAILRDLSTAESQLATAIKKKEVALATRASGDLRMAQLEAEQIELRIESLRAQLERLQITSPADGVLVQGDWFGNDGMPVTLGQSLFEIADLHQMIGEIRLKPEDLPYVKPGAKAIVRTEATGSKSFATSIQRIEPHAEVIDDQAIFLADVELNNSDEVFRPGMKCHAVVDAGYQRLGWVLFRKPYRWLMNQVIW